MSKLLLMCLEFFKTGLFAVGGGLATLPFLAQIQQKYQWFTAEELTNMIAVSESTPGPIGVNMATYVGFTSLGVGGGILATLSLVLPSLIVIMVIARVLDKYRENRWIQGMFVFVRPAVTGLIAAAGFSVLRVALLRQADSLLSSVDWLSAALFAVLLVLTQVKKLTKVHPAAYIGVGAALGVLLSM